MTHIKLAFAATLVMAFSGQTAVAQDYKMRISVPSASGGAICKLINEKWADRIKERSQGRIKTEVFCDSTLSHVGDTVTRVAAGVIDAGWDLPNVYGARFAHYGVVGLPGIVNDVAAGSRALYKMQEQGIFPPIEGVRIATLQLQNSAMIWTREPIKEATKLDGTKVITGSALRGATVVEMGGIPLSLRVPEYYQALSKGAGDGLMTNLGPLFDYKLYEILPNAYAAPWGAGVTFTFVSDAWFKSLPADLQDVISSTMGADASAESAVAFEEDEQAKLKKVADAGLVKVHVLSKDDLAKLQPAFDTVSASWTKSTDNGPAYLDGFKKTYGELTR